MTVGSMPRNRPNILLMISHDLGCHIGPYGWAIDQSPNLNRFAQQSLQFDRHFVTSPGCSQSRSSLVTGRYPHANGQFGLAHLGWSLNRDENLLPAVLRQADYQTALFGIWHLHDWTLAGFESVSGMSQGAPHRPGPAPPTRAGNSRNRRPRCETPRRAARPSRCECRLGCGPAARS